MELTHASFFSGVGGLDLGLERAGWRTVSFSEIEPYACAVLAERWPGVPNLRDIVALAAGVQLDGGQSEPGLRPSRADWGSATLWSGGFPCQDLSVAGKRAGLAGQRSGLAFAFLELVEQHRPECVLLENVPGLLSSHSGRDLGALLGRLGDAGYGWAYRVLDAQWAGVPQRRRRVFILALDLERHPDPDSAGKVLAVGAGCRRDHQEERAAWAAAAGRAGRGAGIIGQAVSAKWAKRSSGPAGDEHHNLVVSPPPDPDGVRAAPRVERLHPGGDGAVQPDGPAWGLDDQPVVVGAIQPGAKGWRGMRGDGADPMVFVKGKRAQSVEDDESWRADDVTPTLNAFDVGDTRATTLVAAPTGEDDPLLPLGLDSHRYRVIGNGVASPIAEWIGRRLAAFLGAAADAWRDGAA